MTYSAENGLPACDCDSMGGRFGAHQPECPWQVAYEAQLAAENDAQVHRDALADTGHAYSTFRGVVLTCLWCDYETRAKTKREAMVLMQKHYDRVLPEGCDLR